MTNRTDRPRRPRGRVSARTAAAPVLYRVRTVRVECRVRANSDQRRRVDRYTVEYRDPDTGVEYRKAYECLPDDVPTIPDRGTSAQLSALAVQWR